MIEEELKEVVHLKEQIDELNKFIFLASRDGFWEKIVFKKKISLFTNVMGYAEDAHELRLNKKLSAKVIEVLKEQVAEWEEEFKRI